MHRDSFSLYASSNHPFRPSREVRLGKKCGSFCMFCYNEVRDLLYCLGDLNVDFVCCADY